MIYIYQFLQGKQSFSVIVRDPQGLFLHQKNLEVNTCQPRGLTCVSKFNTITCQSCLLGSRVFLQQSNFKLWCLGNLSKGIQLCFFLILFHVMQKAKQEEKILFCNLEVQYIEGIYTYNNLQEETVGILCHPILHLIYLKTPSTVSTVWSSVVILLKFSFISQNWGKFLPSFCFLYSFVTL